MAPNGTEGLWRCCNYTKSRARIITTENKRRTYSLRRLAIFGHNKLEEKKESNLQEHQGQGMEELDNYEAVFFELYWETVSPDEKLPWVHGVIRKGFTVEFLLS
ncbi:hypothetical protein K1719_006451 [Acacia pycnantha]|nr:hypothetical protein K1719_006451 [Acacia pycnantha]